MSVQQEHHLDGAEAGTRHPSSIWRNHDFVLLWSGQVVSSVGTQVSMLAFPLLLLAVTHSPAETGLLSGLRTLPYILLTLPVGAWVDRWDRKKVMIYSDIGRAVALGSIPLAIALGHLSLVQLALASLLEGTLFTFFNVAESACLPQVVGKERLSSAVAFTSTTDSATFLVGPSLGGALYAAASALPFLVDAVSYTCSVISLFFIRAEFQEARTVATRGIWVEIQEGVSWLWHNRLMRFLAILVGGLNLCSMGYPLIMIVRAQQLHAGSFAIGLLFATGGLGSIAGALCTVRLQRRFSFGQVMIGATWVWVLTWLPYALAPNLVALGIANVVGWFIIPIFMNTQFSYRLTIIPDELQGRVNSVFKLVAFGSQPISLALTGVLLQAYGPISTVLIITAPQLILAAITQFNPSIRAAPHLADVHRG